MSSSDGHLPRLITPCGLGSSENDLLCTPLWILISLVGLIMVGPRWWLEVQPGEELLWILWAIEFIWHSILQNAGGVGEVRSRKGSYSIREKSLRSSPGVWARGVGEVITCREIWEARYLWLPEQGHKGDMAKRFPKTCCLFLWWWTRVPVGRRACGEGGEPCAGEARPRRSPLPPLSLCLPLTTLDLRVCAQSEPDGLGVAPPNPDVSSMERTERGCTPKWTRPSRTFFALRRDSLRVCQWWKYGLSPRRRQDWHGTRT